MIVGATVYSVILAFALIVAGCLMLERWRLCRMRRFLRFFSDPWRDYPKLHVTWLTVGRRHVALPLRDVAVIIWFKQLLRARQPNQGRPLLVRFRPEFRWIVWCDLIRPLIWCVQQEDAEIRALGVYLLGKLDVQGAGHFYVNLATDSHSTVRKEVARALRRKAAFADLARLSEDSDARVRGLANTLLTRRRSHAERLLRFAAHSSHTRARVARASSMPLFLREPIAEPTLPKTRSWIRRILEHIRSLVRRPLQSDSNGADRAA